MTEAELDEVVKQVMQLSNLDTTRNSYIHIEERDDTSLLMKFMSDRGKNDKSNGLVLHKLMRKARLYHEYWDDRKFVVATKPFLEFLRRQGVRHA